MWQNGGGSLGEVYKVEETKHGRGIGKVTPRRSSWRISRRNEGLKNSKRSWPQLKEETLQTAASGVCFDGFHPRVLVELLKETCEEVVTFLWKH